MSKIDFIRTPIPMLQIVTGGGIRFSTMVELWGSTKAGKTTTCYQSAGYFLNDYGDSAMLKILDSESSFDDIRMKFVFGIDRHHDPRVELKPAFFVEDGMKKILDWVEEMPEDKFMMIIWDTISTSPTKSSYSATRDAKSSSDLTMWAGGQADRPRVIKHYSRDIMSAIYEKKVSVWFPNQVFSSMRPYGSSEVSGEGSAFHHNIHYSIYFRRKETSYDNSNNSISNYTVSLVSLTKSKFSPEFEDTPIYINNQYGGIIDEKTSLFLHALNKGKIVTKGGYYYWKYVPDPNNPKNLILDQNEKGRRWENLINDDEVYKHLVKSLITFTRLQYPIIDRVYVVQGFPALSSEGGESENHLNQTKFSLSSFLSQETSENSIREECGEAKVPTVSQGEQENEEEVVSEQASQPL